MRRAPTDPCQMLPANQPVQQSLLHPLHPLHLLRLSPPWPLRRGIGFSHHLRHSMLPLQRQVSHHPLPRNQVSLVERCCTRIKLEGRTKSPCRKGTTWVLLNLMVSLPLACERLGLTEVSRWLRMDARSRRVATRPRSSLVRGSITDSIACAHGQSWNHGSTGLHVLELVCLVIWQYGGQAGWACSRPSTRGKETAVRRSAV